MKKVIVEGMNPESISYCYHKIIKKQQFNYKIHDI